MFTNLLLCGVEGLLNTLSVLFFRPVCQPSRSQLPGWIFGALDAGLTRITSRGKKLLKSRNQPDGSLPPARVPPGACWVVVVLDRSSSMGDTDYRPSRLEAGKQAILAFAEQRSRVRPLDVLSVVGFDDRADWAGHLDCLGSGPALAQLPGVLGSLTPRGGTDLSKGLGLVEERLWAWDWGQVEEGVPPSLVRVLVLTDGHSQSNPLGRAKALKARGVVIEVVGIGGSPSEVNEAMLKQCASVENGRLLYRFIGDQGGTEALVQHFKGIALT